MLQKQPKGFFMKLKRIIAVMLAAGLISMNIMPAYSITSKTQQTKKQKDEEISKIDYINLEWWQGFNDEYLDEYILKAIENNYDLKIMETKVEQARQSVKAQMASELPSVYVGTSPGIAKMPGSTKSSGSFIIPMIANYEIDIFLKNHDKTKSVRKVYEASKFNEQAAYLSIASAVGSTYYNIVKADKLIEIQKQIVSDRKKISELMKLRNEQGITSTSDLVQAEKAYILSETDLTELERLRDTLLTSLAVLVGDSPDNISEYKRISYDDIKTKKSVPNEIPTEVIVARPDYKAAEKMIEKAGIDVRVAKKEFLPTFNISGLLGLMSMSGMSMSWENALAGAGIMALLPVFTGGKRIANLKFQKTKYEEMLNEYQKTNINAIKEVNDALSDLKYNTEKYEKNMTALEKEQTDYKFAQDKFNEGVISKLDLIQKNEVLLTTQKLAVSENMNTYINQISLYKSTAGADY